MEPAAQLPHVLTSCSSVRQACAAYSFITIPSLSSIFSRLGLYLLSSQVALANQCLSQGERRSSSLDLLLPPSRLLTLSRVSLPCLPPADAFLKAAVSLLPEVPRSISVEGKQRSSESFLLDFINNLLATLLVVPVTRSLFLPLEVLCSIFGLIYDFNVRDKDETKRLKVKIDVKK